MPATSAWVPSPPATPSRSAPSATAWRARAPTSTGPGPSSRATCAPEGLGLVLETEPGHLPAARARVHDQVRPLGRRGVVLAHLLGGGVAAQRGPAGGDGHRPAARSPPARPTAAPCWCTGPARPAGPRPPRRRPASGPGPCGSGPTTPRPRLRARPANPTSTRARPFPNPATSGATSTAAAAATKARRACQRWATLAPPGVCCSVVTIAIPRSARPPQLPALKVSVAGRRPSRHPPKQVRSRSTSPALGRDAGECGCVKVHHRLKEAPCGSSPLSGDAAHSSAAQNRRRGISRNGCDGVAVDSFHEPVGRWRRANGSERRQTMASEHSEGPADTS